MGRFKAGRPRRRKVKRFTREVIETLKGMVGAGVNTANDATWVRQASGLWALGQRSDASKKFTGKIGLLKIYNRTLSPQEIADLACGPFYDMKKRKRGRYWLNDLDRGPE